MSDNLVSISVLDKIVKRLRYDANKIEKLNKGIEGVRSELRSLRERVWKLERGSPNWQASPQAGLAADDFEPDNGNWGSGQWTSLYGSSAVSEDGIEIRLEKDRLAVRHVDYLESLPFLSIPMDVIKGLKEEG